MAAAAPKGAPFLPSHRWPGQHHYQSVEVDPQHEPRPQPSPLPYEVDPKDQLSTVANSAALPWRPSYLRRRVMAGFLVAFVIFLIVIEVLLALSDKNYGIATSHMGRHYLWTYGPTAVLTLVAALWGRVEYQSKLVAPWIRLSKPHADPGRALLLDYVSQFQLFAVFSSLRRRDFTVSVTTAVAILIKILIVVSTGLITLSWTAVSSVSHPLAIQDRFVDDANRLVDGGNLPFFYIRGLADRNLSFTDGVTADWAFQSVRTDLPMSSEKHFTVDGLSFSLDCQPATINLTGARPYEFRQRDLTYMNLTISSPGCNSVSRGLDKLNVTGPGWMGYNRNTSISPFARFQAMRCDGTTDEAGMRILVIFGNLTYTLDYTKNATDYTGHIIHATNAQLVQSTQMVCLPEYRITKVEVVQNDTQTKSVTVVPGASNRTLGSVTAWKIFEAQNAAYESTSEQQTVQYGQSINISMDRIDVDLPMKSSILLWLQDQPDGKSAMLYDPNVLQGAGIRYFRQMGVIVAKQFLMAPEQESTTTTGTVTFNENRLIVRSWAAQWMAGLVAACVLLTALGMFLVPRNGILPRNPGNIPGLASLVSRSEDLVNTLRDAGSTDKDSLERLLAGSEFRSGVVHDPASIQGRCFSIIDLARGRFDREQARAHTKHIHPGVLHPASRLALCLALIGLIITLEMLLRKSTNEDGLGDVGDDRFLHYTWTTIPAVVLGILTMVFSSMDFQIRSLVPYAALKKTTTMDVLVWLDFLDLSIPRALYREVKFTNLAAFATTSTLLVGSLFTIFSGSLFQSISVSVETTVSLVPNMSFSTRDLDDPDDFTGVASLILRNNYSYPRFTYGDLAFPTYRTALPLPESSVPLSIKAVVPAVRTRMDCRRYDASQMQTNLTIDYRTDIGLVNPLGVNVTGEECRGNSKGIEQFMYNWWVPTYANETYFGEAFTPVDHGKRCSDVLYVWGKLDYKAQPILQNIMGLGCNFTFEVVDVDATFVGPNLDFDPNNPPIPRNETARDSPLKVRFRIGNDAELSSRLFAVYLGLATTKTDPQRLDQFFALLTSSTWAVPMSDLGDPAAHDKVAEAIKFQHGIIQAQMFNSPSNRIPANMTDTTFADPQPGDNDAKREFQAIASDANGRRRVVQDMASTRVLQALLATALILLVLAWILLPQTDVLPRAPTSIASAASLVAGGNLLALLPDHAERRTDGDLVRALGPTTRLWMGWGTPVGPDGEKVLSGEGMDGGAGGLSRFGIFAVRDGMVVEEQETAYRGAAGTQERAAVRASYLGDDRGHHQHVASGGGFGWR